MTIKTVRRYNECCFRLGVKEDDYDAIHFIWTFGSFLSPLRSPSRPCVHQLLLLSSRHLSKAATHRPIIHFTIPTLPKILSTLPSFCMSMRVSHIDINIVNDAPELLAFSGGRNKGKKPIKFCLAQPYTYNQPDEK